MWIPVVNSSCCDDDVFIGIKIQMCQAHLQPNAFSVTQETQTFWFSR